ncbi:MAG TPA: septum formation initiator family protein [Bryobacteraceae bacterium]|jgi:cell division protein FtsB|nr:septum formation initiator family protein [Bryobacteraceae bacterium]
MLRFAAYVIAFSMVGVCGLIAFRGPQGLPVLMEKRREIRQLQEQNADLARENEIKRNRLERLKRSQAEQELEIRKRLKLLRPGETTFILPEGENPERSKEQ